MKLSVRFAFLLLTMGVGACMAGEWSLTAEEEALAVAAKVEPSVVRKVRSMGERLTRWTGQNEAFDEVPADGIVLHTASGKGEEINARLRVALAGTSYRSYLLENAYGHGPDQVVVAAVDDAGFLAIVRPDAVNYGMDHEAVMVRYREWQKRYGLNVLGAGVGWIDAEITLPPADWKALARDVYAFCPDVVDQGTGDLDSLAREMKETRHLYLWWD